MSNDKTKHNPPKTACPCDPLINAIRHEDKNAKIPQKRFWRDWEPIEKFTFCIAIFTFIYSMISIGIYFVSRDTMIVSQRAWVVYDKLIGTPSSNINNSGNPGKIIQPSWLNAGNTPTRNFHIYTAPIVRTEKPIDKNYTFQKVNMGFSPAVLGPKGSISGTPLTVTIDDFEKIKNGTLVLTFWGEVTYNDIFPHTPLHITKFCQETIGIIANDPKSLWNNSVLQFETCTTHNCIDEECKKQ